MSTRPHHFVIPAKAGIQLFSMRPKSCVPAFAGTTAMEVIFQEILE
jgi:hypothetical protein